MSSEQQREELHRILWKMAEESVGVGRWLGFKSYVLGMLFYRFISENLTSFINREEKRVGGENFDYSTLSDEDSERGREDTIKERDFYLLPSELFVNVRKNAGKDENLNETLGRVFRNIENSARGTASEEDLQGLFDDIDLNSSRLGNTVSQRNEKLQKILDVLGSLSLGEVQEHDIDTFGDAYEYLMSLYASHAGKSGGEFFTPQEVSELLAKITVAGKSR